MNTEMNYPWHVYKKHLVALSCVTALAAFSLVARPAFAEEVKASDTNAKTEVVAPAIENVVATVETKTLDENPTATTTDPLQTLQVQLSLKQIQQDQKYLLLKQELQ